MIVMVVGVIFAVAGVVTYIRGLQRARRREHQGLRGREVLRREGRNGPFTAYSEAETISKHALEATGGKTYAELAKDDPLRTTAMQASFLRASLFTSVVAFGVAALAAVLGVMLFLIGWSLSP